MKRVLFLLLIYKCFFLPIHSQTTDSGVDSVKITCLYQQVFVSDTLKPEEKDRSLMLLQIGNHLSKYYPYTIYLSDSVSFELRKKAEITGNKIKEQELFDETVKKLPRVSYMADFQIFKQYPQKGQLTFHQYIGGGSNMYEEAMPDFHWKLSADTLTVCGYLCKKATTAFRGRNYEVWYTKDIPVSDGPWKFSGLPGLVLKATDEQGFFSFECTAIETPSTVKPIYKRFSSKSAKKLSRTEFNKAIQRFMDSPGAYMTGSPLIVDALPAEAYEKRPYNSIERSGE